MIILTEWDMFSNKASKSGVSTVVTQRNGHLAPTPANGEAPAKSTDGTFSASSSVSDLSSLMPPRSPASITRYVKLDWKRISQLMEKPMHVFDGRNTVDVAALEELGFRVEAIGVASKAAKARLMG